VRDILAHFLLAQGPPDGQVKIEDPLRSHLNDIDVLHRVDGAAPEDGGDNVESPGIQAGFSGASSQDLTNLRFDITFTPPAAGKGAAPLALSSKRRHRGNDDDHPCDERGQPMPLLMSIDHPNQVLHAVTMDVSIICVTAADSYSTGTKVEKILAQAEEAKLAKNGPATRLYLQGEHWPMVFSHAGAPGPRTAKALRHLCHYLRALNHSSRNTLSPAYVLALIGATCARYHLATQNAYARATHAIAAQAIARRQFQSAASTNLRSCSARKSLDELALACIPPQAPRAYHRFFTRGAALPPPQQQQHQQPPSHHLPPFHPLAEVLPSG
jgi:hypothetical protein